MEDHLTSLKITQLLRKDIITILGEDVIRSFGKKNIGFTILTSLKLWISIGALFILGDICIKSENFSYLSLIFIACLMATRINALNVQVHEGSHYLLGNNKFTNDLFCNCIFAYSTGIDVETYRSVHFSHHNYLNEEKDPDLDLYTYEKKQFFYSILKDFFGITAINRLKTYGNISKSKKQSRKNDYHFFGKAIANFSIISLLILAFGFINGIELYIFLWVFPLVSIFPLIIRMRTISEHSPILAKTNENRPLFIARTTKANVIEKYILGAQMEYHFEHHVFPNIPYRSQKLMHDILWKCGYFKKNLKILEYSNAISTGYVSSTKELLTY